MSSSPTKSDDVRRESRREGLHPRGVACLSSASFLCGTGFSHFPMLFRQHARRRDSRRHCCQLVLHPSHNVAFPFYHCFESCFRDVCRSVFFFFVPTLVSSMSARAKKSVSVAPGIKIGLKANAFVQADYASVYGAAAQQSTGVIDRQIRLKSNTL
jgi:hypothetical protein